jgi:hypothetical protein
MSADPDARRRFVELVPEPPLTPAQARALAELEANADPARRCKVAKRWARLGASTCFAWSDPLSDPRVLDRIAARLSVEADTTVLVEIVGILVGAVTKHLAHAALAERCEPLLGHASAEVRNLAVLCVGRLLVRSWEPIVPLFDDRAPKVRVAAIAAAEAAELPLPTDGLTYDVHMRPCRLPDDVYALVESARRQERRRAQRRGESAREHRPR